jgi:preprotein translocase subunit YajC
METKIVTAILVFNIVLMLFYFVVKINKRNRDKAEDAINQQLADSAKANLTEKQKAQLNDLITNTTISAEYNKNSKYTINANHITATLIQKENFDKNVTAFGLLLQAKSNSNHLNLIQLSFLLTTKKNATYVINEKLNLIGFFTPFHIVLLDMKNWKLTQSLENDYSESSETITLQCMTKESKEVNQISIAIKKPFLDPLTFIQTYYYKDFKSLIEKAE